MAAIAHCGLLGQSRAVNGKTTRPGLYKCYACRKPFTVRMGTIFRVQPAFVHLLATSRSSHVRQQERDQHSSISADAQICSTENRVVLLGRRIREVMAPVLTLPAWWRWQEGWWKRTELVSVPQTASAARKLQHGPQDEGYKPLVERSGKDERRFGSYQDDRPQPPICTPIASCTPGWLMDLP